MRTIASCKSTNRPVCELMIVDEAYQATFADVSNAADNAEQILMVGDPGQIGPVVTADVSAFRGKDQAPHMRAPEVFVQKAGAVVHRLDTTYRLGQETVDAIAPLYGFPFTSSRPDRYLTDENGNRVSEIVPLKIPVAPSFQHIFSNDTSTDVRDDFRDLIGAGETAETATLKILCGPIPDAAVEIDPDDNDIWLGLAATQHKTGHIVAAVIERALRITESQDELERWELPDRKRRASALAKLRETLLQPPPPPAVIKPRRLSTTNLLQGQHQVFTDPDSGAKLLLRVHDFHEDADGRYVCYVVLAWDGREESLEYADRIPILVEESRKLWWRRGFMVTLFGRKPKKENLRLLDVRLHPPPYPRWQSDRLIPRDSLLASRATMKYYFTRWDKVFRTVSHSAAVPLSIRDYNPPREDAK